MLDLRLALPIGMEGLWRRMFGGRCRLGLGAGLSIEDNAKGVSYDPPQCDAAVERIAGRGVRSTLGED